ncbi:MAG: AmmeMemoRadiSam system radical SAM enzyme [Eubacterium sp.]|nr:AmmeMemoRadiSam system radical SAM enzyme [Eubacterium sp.]
MARCEVCFRHCDIKEGSLGFCGARACRDDKVAAVNYGRITGIALDPIEKKPLARFYPGSMILSVGSYGCNLRCPFCQNYDISWSDETMAAARRINEDASDRETRYISPEELAFLAARYKPEGNIGVAFTYNEPLIGYEYVRDTARLVKAGGMKNVLVSNGTAELSILLEILPFIDAMNIDLKGFTDDYYCKVLGGSRKMTMDFIERAVKDCHVELTTLIIPGENDSEEEMREMTDWIAGLKDDNGRTIGAEIPLHISRFFPRFKMLDRDATDIRKVYRLAEVAREKLKYVYTGNC